MSDIEEILRDAKSLGPADRLRVIARLWASLPADHWAAPTASEQDRLRRQLAHVDIELIDEVPWKIVERMSDRHATITGTKIYSAPRRFDLATIFVVTSAYAILFGSMSALQFPPSLSLIIAGFLALVAIGQALLYRGLRPRRASIVVGVTAIFMIVGGRLLFNSRMPPGPLELGGLVLGAVIYGVLLGYIGGVLVGGVFLVADYVRQRFRRKQTVPTEIEPHTSDGG